MQLKESVNRVLTSLTERDRNILKLRMGVGCDFECTLETIAQQYGVTRERIRQIEAKALRRITHPSRLKYLKDFYAF